VVEPQPSKLMVRVRFPLPAPEWCNCSAGVAFVWAHIAQLVEHFLGKEEVTGSNPVMSSIIYLTVLLTDFFREIVLFEEICDGKGSI
jgi:hypothetical protein